MKKVLITLTMLLALGMGAQAAGQKHRHTPQQELTDSTSKGGVEVFSDTTSSDTVIRASKGHVTINTPMGSHSWDYDVKDDDDFGSIFTMPSAICEAKIWQAYCSYWASCSSSSCWLPY